MTTSVAPAPVRVNAAHLAKMASLPNIDSGKAYQALGMAKEYKKAISKIKKVEDPNLWTIMMLKGISPDRIVKCLLGLGVKVHKHPIDSLDKEVTHNDRDPNIQGSYLVNFKRALQTRNGHVNPFKKWALQGSTLCEGLLLELSCFLSIHKHLDTEKINLCNASRCSNGNIPSIHYYLVTNEVCIFRRAAGDCIGNIRSVTYSYLTLR
ncbi:MAG: hypothetical protein A3A98_00435 [Candidatus Staskawiczbacteria bacterium RIFCSPLOWO2_01_FULL_40_39]|uniref:Uncharacterized protein n=1 Tax=Candidatus Staskawiczbacteria bacterium RIFCSPHIGHO2_01_FULL_39_25 TaxID=1802202 RepID=A0A1G2HMN4_9BACT|nr:MAG: hypothetical protein A2730_00435 [Candidatus Staskawiczbacteria bacterium RIFCSPHIGHO2_01_FULL_39_25]OGZ73203.1 MAG: hypothetical protein A3A98_00435 [Candidatus Staskawiczbacteria bacterium RIFCSPLOWO2_01_FULL_40_39]